jgi:hypothetical protein
MATGSTMGSIFDAVKGAAGAYGRGSETSNPKEARKELDNLWESIKKLPVVGKAAATAFDGLSKAASIATGAVTSGLGLMGAAALKVTDQMAAPLAAIQSFGDQIGSLVRLANPGVWQQFQVAMLDAWAVLGGQLTPVLQGLTILGRAVGDNLAKLTPVVQPLFDKLGQGIANIAAGVGPVVEGLAPLVEVFIDVMGQLTEWFSRSIGVWQGIVSEVLKTINSMFGLTSKRFKPDADSNGAAVRGVSVSSTEQFSQDVFRRNAQMAFGTGQGKKPEDHLPEIAASINEGKAIVAAIRDNIREIGLAIISLLPMGGTKQADQLRDEMRRSDELERRRAALEAGQALKK